MLKAICLCNCECGCSLRVVSTSHVNFECHCPLRLFVFPHQIAPVGPKIADILDAELVPGGLLSVEPTYVRM